ncbi:solute carrier organic anion transporter family member 74D-like [Drosophila tropicalis]|uniref:solute carrier organic anion transporter family member 74D-like n=1 Tax=Drosophila tropicalis TaxID=46794 RepID=UPI0035AB97AC
MSHNEVEVREKFLQDNTQANGKKSKDLPKEITCGIWHFKGSQLQRFATENMFMVLYGIAGCFMAMAFSYSNGTITTLEKRFKIPTKISGLISVGNDISSVFSSAFLAYYAGRGHRPRWIAVGLLFMFVFCLMTALPHFLYGAGEDALKLTQHSDILNSSKANAEDLMLCHRNSSSQCEMKETSASVPIILLFMAQFISGIGGALFFTLGLPYMDDNSLKSKTPSMLSWSAFLRMLGPAAGYSLASFCLRLYIDPWEVPSIKNSDPRWLGAWWLGWLVLAVTMLISAIVIYMFPREMPSAYARRLQSKGDSEKKEATAELSLGGMMQCLKRLSKNRVYVCNTIASTLYVFGYLPYWIFTPKYIETQYRQTAATASMATGPVALGFSAAGVLLTGFVLSKYKPSARWMAAWNGIVDVLTIAGILCYVAIGCEESDRANTLSALTSSADNCSLSCHCDYVPYSPICGSQNFTYISACHAGCQHKENDPMGRTIYTECKCMPSVANDIKEAGDPQLPFAVDGPCPVDCQRQFLIFMVVMCLLKFIGSTGRVTNLLLALRCVPPEDKTFGLGFGHVVVSIFALIPSPIIFGWILDYYCLVWGKTCSNKGNCWLYDTRSLRYVMNLISATFIFLGCFGNIAVWYYAKDLEIFDENEGKPNEPEELELKDKEDIILE